MKPLLTAVGLAGLSMALASNAQADGATWLAQSFEQEMDQKKSVAADYTYSGVRVWSLDPDQPEIRFGCSERYGLTANITFLPLSQGDVAKNERIRIRYMSTNMTIEGRKTEYVPWTVVKETRTVQTRSGKHAAMIYNAVVQGLPITIKEPYKKNITLTPAAIDEAFTWFAQNCPVTSG